MAPPKHFFRYGPAAAIRIAKVRDLAAHLNITLLTTNGKIKKTERFFITVDVPNYETDNLFPVVEAKKLGETSVRMHAVVFDLSSATLTGLTAATKMVVGTPLNPPQRKKKHKRAVRHQTFVFPAPTTFATGDGMNVVVVVRSAHLFFDDQPAGMGGVSFDDRRTVTKVMAFPFKH